MPALAERVLLQTSEVLIDGDHPCLRGVKPLHDPCNVAHTVTWVEVEGEGEGEGEGKGKGEDKLPPNLHSNDGIAVRRSRVSWARVEGLYKLVGRNITYGCGMAGWSDGNGPIQLHHTCRKVNDPDPEPEPWP